MPGTWPIPVSISALDAVPLSLPEGEVMFTTDGFTVQPLEFPGGNIGSLAVHGTTNDLAVAGAEPLYLSLNAFIEEGMEIATLDRIVATLAATAKEIGVRVVAGDTKVLRRGEGGGLVPGNHRRRRYGSPAGSWALTGSLMVIEYW